jgi:hypothetical protein
MSCRGAARAIDESGASLTRIREILEETDAVASSLQHASTSTMSLPRSGASTEENTELLARTLRGAGALKQRTQDLVSVVALAAHRAKGASRIQQTN